MLFFSINGLYLDNLNTRNVECILDFASYSRMGLHEIFLRLLVWNVVGPAKPNPNLLAIVEDLG